MRTLAAALLVLALPTTAHAQIASRPLPATGYRTPPLDGHATTQPGSIDRPRDERYQTPRSVGAGSPGAVTVSRELDRARRDIDRRRDSGELSRDEARVLRREAGRIDALVDRYRDGGFTEFERRELELHATELRNRTATGRAL